MDHAATRPFLMAHWRRLMLVSYALEASRVAAVLPDGLEPDLFEGRAACSIAAFQFADMRVFGLGIPGLRRFSELNLRVYARDPATDRCGVCFVREIVPHRLVVWGARKFYNEPYVRAPVASGFGESPDSVRLRHRVAMGGRAHRFEARGEKPTARPHEESAAHWFKERRWGFGALRSGETVSYRVEHPVWEVWPTLSWDMDMDAGILFGERWRVLNELEPVNVTLAVGSDVEVFPHRPLHDAEREGPAEIAGNAAAFSGPCA